MLLRYALGAIGAAFAIVLLIAFGNGAYNRIASPPAPTVEHEFHKTPKDLHLASDGPLGKFDRRQLQRGFQVYQEVCSACHSLRLVAFRDLKDLGYSDAEVKAIAKNWKIPQPAIDPNTGDATTRPSLPADHFPSPFANETAARAANNNALPPDQSLLAKARHDGAAYIYSILTGYENQPAELLRHFPDARTPKGLHYNPYFANLNLAMAPPLTAEGQVTYEDGTRATVDQMAKDVSAFLVWTAEPKLETRHAWGITVLIFLAIFTVLTYMSYQNIWAGKKH